MVSLGLSTERALTRRVLIRLRGVTSPARHQNVGSDVQATHRTRHDVILRAGEYGQRTEAVVTGPIVCHVLSVCRTECMGHARYSTPDCDSMQPSRCARARVSWTLFPHPLQVTKIELPEERKCVTKGCIKTRLLCVMQTYSTSLVYVLGATLS